MDIRYDGERWWTEPGAPAGCTVIRAKLEGFEARREVSAGELSSVADQPRHCRMIIFMVRAQLVDRAFRAAGEAEARRIRRGE